MRSTSARIVGTMLVCLLLAVPPSFAQGQTRGSFHLFFPSSLGNSGYTILYNYPSEVAPGRDLNVTIIVEVDQLSGLKLYLQSYGLLVSVSARGLGTVYAQVNRSNIFLYQGSHWGPVNVTLPLGKSPQPSKSLVGNVSVSFSANVWHGDPIFFSYPEGGARTVGNLTILAGSSYWDLAGNGLLLILASVVAVVIALGVILRARTPSRIEGKVKPL